MPPEKREYWYCGGHPRVGHVVGEIGYTDLQPAGVRVTTLLLYDQSQPFPPEQVPTLRGRIVGTALDLRCTVCGRTYDWYIGVASMQKMLAGRKMG